MKPIRRSRSFAFVCALVVCTVAAVPSSARELWVSAQSRAVAVPVPSDFGDARSAAFVVMPEATGDFEYALEVQLLQAGRPAQVRRVDAQRVMAREGEPLEIDVTPFLPAGLVAGRDYVYVRLLASAVPLGLRFDYEAPEAPARTRQPQLQLHTAKGQPFDQLRADLETLSAKVDGEVQRLDGILIGLSAELDDEVKRLDGILIGLSQELQEQVARLDQVLIALNQELDEVDAKTLANKLELEKQKLDIESSKLEIEKSKTDITKNKTDITKNATDIQDVKQKHELLKGDFDQKKLEYEIKLSLLESKTGTVDSKVDLTKDQLKEELASKELLKKSVDDKLKKEIEFADFALDQQKDALLALIASLLQEKELAATDEKKAKLQAHIDELNAQKDSLDEARELNELRMQTLQDKLSKMYQMMSNIMKAQHDTAKTIINNLR